VSPRFGPLFIVRGNLGANLPKETWCPRYLVAKVHMWHYPLEIFIFLS
jgi:hypothetical protein